MNYIQIRAAAGLTAPERAHKINQLLYTLIRPVHLRSPEDVTTALFCVEDQGDSVYLIIIPEYIIHIHPEYDKTTLQELQDLFPELPDTERTRITALIEETHQFSFADMIPSGSVVLGTLGI